MIRHYLILLAFSLFMLSGCSLITRTQQNPEMARAEVFIQNGQNKEAAAIYKQLADSKSSQQNYHRLLAADALIRANDIKQAQQYLNMIDVSAFDEAQLNHLSLLQAQIDLSEGNAETALDRLRTVQTELLNNQTKVAYYQSLAFAYSLTGDTLQSAQALINIDSLTLAPKMRNKHYEQILSTLSVMSEEALHLKQPLSNRTLSGWMALARVFKLDEANLSDNLAKWRKLYPAHPANSAFLGQYVKNYQRNLAQPAMIAVFLPESGAYAAPATVIKNGFIIAYKLAKKAGETTSELRFYDSEKNSAANLYQQAVKDGARLVVGPLDKKDIKALVNSAELTVPVLALNHVEGLSHPKLYQYGLSPIDDAEQITVKAHHDGHQNALFLVPKTEQGKRFSSYLTDSWQKLGGKTVKMESYNDSKSDFSQLIQQIFKQNADEELSDNDADVVIINAYAKPAQLLYSRLHKNRATSELPVYATSQIYLGDADAIRDKNLDGITFCDVPWVFSQAYPGELSKFSLHDSWQNLSPSYLRLLPMGIDAYNLIAHLSQLKNQPYSGATGRLKLNADNRIIRELYCAKFVEGVPKVMGFANEELVSDTAPVAKQPDSTTVTGEQGKPGLPKLPRLDDAVDSLPTTEPANATVR